MLARVSLRVLPETHWRRDWQGFAFRSVFALSSAMRVECTGRETAYWRMEPLQHPKSQQHQSDKSEIVTNEVVVHSSQSESESIASILIGAGDSS